MRYYVVSKHLRCFRLCCVRSDVFLCHVISLTGTFNTFQCAEQFKIKLSLMTGTIQSRDATICFARGFLCYGTSKSMK
jgi:hypothetical protein